jgi:GntR family transcriptional regulator
MALTALVNPNTVQRAYEQLERDGILVSKRGSGMAVAEDAERLAHGRSLDGVRSNFARGVEVAQAAGLSRSVVDGIYRDTWNGTPDPAEASR